MLFIGRFGYEHLEMPARPAGSGAFRRGVLNLFLKRLPNSVIAHETLLVGLFLTGRQKTRFAFRNFGSGLGLSAHKSPSQLDVGRDTAGNCNRNPPVTLSYPLGTLDYIAAL